jgi:hypothetical protein
LTRNIGSRDSEASAGKYRNREVAIADPPIDRVRRIRERKISVGRPPERRGRASTLRAEECEGPGGATACCESTVASVWYQSLGLSVHSGRKKKRKIP